MSPKSFLIQNSNELESAVKGPCTPLTISTGLTFSAHKMIKVIFKSFVFSFVILFVLCNIFDCFSIFHYILADGVICHKHRKS